ncbi:MAG TPA: terminase [Terriglobales bacterium]
MGRKKTTKNPTAAKPGTTSKPERTPEVAASETDTSPNAALAVLREAGHKLDQHPHTLTTWSGPIPRGIETVRELVMCTTLKIRDKRGHLLRLRLNRAQRDLEKTSGKRNIVLKARQLGVTTYVAARFFVSCITREGTLSVQVAHDQRSAEEIFRIVHRLLENLPESLRQGALVTSRANVRQIVFPMLDSEYRVETAADPNAGRGLTIHNLHCSEVARWPRDVSETLASLRAAVPPDGEIFLESTPNGAGGTFYDEWQRAPQTGYVRHFYPWWWDPNYRRKLEIVDFSDQERELMHKHNLDPGQIAFRREMRANFGNRAPEEYAEDPESCFLASGDCVFDCDILDERLKQPPVMSEASDNGKLLTFFPPMEAGNGVTPKQYIIGVDPAGGGCDGDYACAQVIERSTGLQCAELRGHFTPQELAARVAVLGRKYNQALVAVERNNHGHAVIAHLAMSAGYQNLYPGGAPPGWLTTAASRPRMLENFAAVLSSASFLFLSPRLLQECRTFIRHRDGTSAAAGGAHDDTVMAMAIALAVRAEVVVRPPQSMRECNFAILQTAS